MSSPASRLSLSDTLYKVGFCLFNAREVALFWFTAYGTASDVVVQVFVSFDPEPDDRRQYHYYTRLWNALLLPFGILFSALYFGLMLYWVRRARFGTVDFLEAAAHYRHSPVHNGLIYLMYAFGAVMAIGGVWQISTIKDSHLMWAAFLSLSYKAALALNALRSIVTFGSVVEIDRDAPVYSVFTDCDLVTIRGEAFGLRAFRKPQQGPAAIVPPGKRSVSGDKPPALLNEEF